MRSKTWASSLLVVLALSTSVQAQDLPSVDAPCAPDVTENRSAAVTHDGQTGLWFHSAVARCMLTRLQSLPLYARRVDLLEQRLTLQDERGALQDRRVALAEQEADVATQTLEAAVRRAREAEEARDVWYRRPGFLLTMGGVIVVALEVVAIVIFRRFSE